MPLIFVLQKKKWIVWWGTEVQRKWEGLLWVCAVIGDYNCKAVGAVGGGVKRTRGHCAMKGFYAFYVDQPPFRFWKEYKQTLSLSKGLPYYLPPQIFRPSYGLEINHTLRSERRWNELTTFDFKSIILNIN